MLDSTVTVTSSFATVADDSSSMSEKSGNELEESSSDSCQDKDEEGETGENRGREVVV